MGTVSYTQNNPCQDWVLYPYKANILILSNLIGRLYCIENRLYVV